jgi:uncharacterized protein YkwD
MCVKHKAYRHMPKRHPHSRPARKPNTALHRQLSRHFKRWLVPHAQNDHRPHLIRAHGLALVAVLILGVQATALATRPVISVSNTSSAGHPLAGSVLAYATDINVAQLFAQTNQERVSNGLPALRLDSRLNSSAGLKAANMFSDNYWAHVSPGGIQPWYWFTQAGYAYSYAGENLAKDFDTTAGVMTGWMNSSGHRANILNPNYVDVGFAVQNGTLQGGQTTLVVAHYGSIAAGGGAAPTAAKPVATAHPVQPAANATPEPSAPPSPTASPSPSATPAHTPAVQSNIAAGTSAPAPVGYSLFKPLALSRTAATPTLITMGLLLILLTVYLFTHMAVWRKRLPRGRRARYLIYAIFSIGALAVAIVWLSTAGFGQVG